MNTDRQKQIRLAAIIVSLALLIIGGYVLLTRASYQKISVHQTPMNEQNYTALYNDDLYSYNGAAFYKVNPHTGSVGLLTAPVVLPNVTSLSWVGDTGALLQFDDANYGTKVADELAKKQLPSDTDTSNYLWYLNFRTSDLALVRTDVTEILQARYLPSKRAAYILAQTETAPGSAESEYTTSYLSYELSTQTARTLISSVGFDEVTDITTCGSKVCVLQSGDTPELWTEENGQKKVVKRFTEYDTITATGSNDSFVGTKNDSTKQTEEYEDEQLQATASLISLSGSVVKLSQKVSANTPLLASVLDATKKQYYIIDTATRKTDNATHFIATGKTVLGLTNSKDFPLKSANDTLFTSHVRDNIFYNSKGAASFVDVDGSVFYIDRAGENYKLESQTESQLLSATKQCLSGTSQFHEYTKEIKEMRIGVTFDQNYATAVAAITNCINRNSPQSFVGHNYVFVGVDPQTGRYVTN